MEKIIFIKGSISPDLLEVNEDLKSSKWKIKEIIPQHVSTSSHTQYRGVAKLSSSVYGGFLVVLEELF